LISQFLTGTPIPHVHLGGKYVQRSQARDWNWLHSSKWFLKGNANNLWHGKNKAMCSIDDINYEAKEGLDNYKDEWLQNLHRVCQVWRFCLLERFCCCFLFSSILRLLNHFVGLPNVRTKFKTN
jgi:hypothetical protein